jgi:hypothetical protein
MIPSEIKYYDNWKNGALNEMRKLPMVRAKIRMFAFEYNLHNMESSLPQYHLKCNHLQEIL